MTLNTNRQTPTMSQALSAIIRSKLERVHVCLPGTVQSYDAATQRANVKPALRARVQGRVGELVEEYPVLVNIPVAFPRAGLASLTFNLQAGDSVVLLVVEASMGSWRRLGGTQTPEDLRRFDLTDAICLPVNLYPSAQAIAPAPPAHVALGYAASAVHVKPAEVALGSAEPTDRVATALKVEAALASLSAALATFATAAGAAVPELLPAIGALSAFLLTWPVASSTASTKVRVDP